MDYIDQLLEKIREWARKIVETLFGPEGETEPELIPIPVRDPQRPVQKHRQHR